MNDRGQYTTNREKGEVLSAGEFVPAVHRTGGKSVARLRSLLSFAVPFVSYHLRGAVSPVLAGYKITHRCNLRCAHCPYWRRSGPEQDFQGVLSTLERLRKMGVRILILEGGEPLLWRDGNKSLEHVIDEARKRFLSVCITTNGILPWRHLPVDRAWVSLDGPPSVHDSIRGAGVFERVMENLRSGNCGEAFVSTTINRVNSSFIPELATLLKGVAAGVTIQFHYPYQGLPDPLFLPPVERAPVLDELIRLKLAGYPVANSVLSLNQLKEPRWICEDKLLANAEPDGTVLHGCYLKNRGPSECSHCGFSAHNEMSLAFRGSWKSIVTGLRTFFR